MPHGPLTFRNTQPTPEGQNAGNQLQQLRRLAAREIELVQRDDSGQPVLFGDGAQIGQHLIGGDGIKAGDRLVRQD